MQKAKYTFASGKSVPPDAILTFRRALSKARKMGQSQMLFRMKDGKVKYCPWMEFPRGFGRVFGCTFLGGIVVI